MDSYNLSFTFDPEQNNILLGLARRCSDINGWNPQKLLQYAVMSNSKAEVDLKLNFLQDAVTHLETVNGIQCKKIEYASRKKSEASATRFLMPLQKCIT